MDEMVCLRVRNTCTHTHAANTYENFQKLSLKKYVPDLGTKFSSTTTFLSPSLFHLQVVMAVRPFFHCETSFPFFAFCSSFFIAFSGAMIFSSDHSFNWPFFSVFLFASQSQRGGKNVYLALGQAYIFSCSHTHERSLSSRFFFMSFGDILAGVVGPTMLIYIDPLSMCFVMIADVLVHLYVLICILFISSIISGGRCFFPIQSLSFWIIFKNEKNAVWKPAIKTSSTFNWFFWRYE